MRRIDNDAIRAAGEIRFRSEYDYAVFEYVRSSKVIQSVERSGVKLKGRVLDAGCGSGGTALSIAEEVAFAVGLDLSPRFSDAGTKLAREKRVRNVAFTQGDGLRLPYANASFDVVLSHSVIEHLPEARAYIAECARVLKPGGRFYLSTAPTLSLAGAHLPRLRVPVPIHLFLGRKLAFRVFVFLAARAPWMLKERSSANTFVKLAESGREKEDDLLTPVTLRGMSSWIADSPFRLISEERYITGFFKRVVPRFLQPFLLEIPVIGDVMVSQIECVLEKTVTARPAVWMFADIRFPSPRANGIQVVKTAHALAARGREVRLIVRHSDPRPTDVILAEFGVESNTHLHLDRLIVGHAPNSSFIPRLRYLTQSLLMARRASRHGALIVTRDLQLADLLLRLRVDGLSYEAHAVEAVMYDERHQLYGHETPPNPAKRRRIENREGRVWRGALGFMATTRGIVSTFERLFGARPRTAVVPNGCDIPKDREFTPPSSDERVVYAGQLYPWKGVDVLIQAFARLSRGELVIVGGLEGESDLDRVRTLALSLNLGDRVKFLGSLAQKDVAGQLARATVVVAPFLKSAMTSEHTSPIKAFEAMAAGRPLLISDTDASREIVDDGRTGIVVPPGDVAAWATALGRVLSDRSLQMTLARAAYEKATQYSWSRRAERIEDFVGGLR